MFGAGAGGEGMHSTACFANAVNVIEPVACAKRPLPLVTVSGVPTNGKIPFWKALTTSVPLWVVIVRFAERLVRCVSTRW